MIIKIHRGTGWNCAEVIARDGRILVDFGVPEAVPHAAPFDPGMLKGKKTKELRRLGMLPDVDGLYKSDRKGFDCVLLSHAHARHYEFLNYIQPVIPVHMSPGAAELVAVSDIFTPGITVPVNVRAFAKDRIAHAGAIKITPFFVDHPAFDSLAYLIEGDRQRIFYSGDYRGQRRKSILFEAMLKRPPKDIDCLIMDGAVVNGEEEYKNGRQVQARIATALKQRGNMCFLVSPSDAIDRLVEAYNACVATDSLFVVDVYTAFLLERLKGVYKYIPQFNWRNVAVHFLDYQADALVKPEYRDLLFNYNKRRIDLPGIISQKNRICLHIRDPHGFFSIAERVGELKRGTIFYSAVEDGTTDELIGLCNRKGLTFERAYTREFPSWEELREFAAAVNPGVVVPLSPERSNSYTELFERVKIVVSGEEVAL